MNESIAAVHKADIEKARELLRGAITEANEGWLPSEAIGDALMLEFIELAGRFSSPTQIAARLTHIATQLNQAQVHIQARAH